VTGTFRNEKSISEKIKTLLTKLLEIISHPQMEMNKKLRVRVD
jgi:hypothetical protein